MLPQLSWYHILKQNPLSYEYLHEKQQADEQLLALQQKYPEQYINMNLDDDVDDIICYVKQGQDPNLCCKLLRNYSVITAYLVNYCRLGSNGGYWPFNITVFWKAIR